MLIKRRSKALWECTSTRQYACRLTANTLTLIPCPCVLHTAKCYGLLINWQLTPTSYRQSLLPLPAMSTTDIPLPENIPLPESDSTVSSESGDFSSCGCPEGRNLVLCIDGTANQFGKKVQYLYSILGTPPSSFIYVFLATEQQRRRVVQPSQEKQRPDHLLQ